MARIGAERELRRENDAERDQPADIAHPPAETRQPAHAFGPHDVGQLRVVEHDRHLRADRRQHDRPRDRACQLGPVGIGPPQRGATDEQQQLEDEDVGFAPARRRRPWHQGTGLISAIRMPDVDCVKAHAAWPFTGSPTMTLAK
jgi:hypothetical protein